MRRLVFLPLFALLLVLPACGSGTIGDLFAIFPPEAFEDPGAGDGGGLPGQFIASEIAALGGGQGVTGEIRNVVLATVASRTYAFLTAQTDGVHVVDVTDPLILNSTDFVTTIDDAHLSSPAASIAGGRVDAVAVVDNTFLVCLAIGSGAVNAVTVFDITLLIEAATNSEADLSGAFITPAGTGIAAPGNSAGKAGGVAGSGSAFFVATGGPDVIPAVIDPGTATWLEGAALDTGATVVETLDVQVNGTSSIHVSGRGPGGAYGIVALAHPALPIPTTPEIETIDVEDFDDIDDFNESVRDIAGPGNFPLDIALDTLTLLLTSDEKVLIYNVSNPFSPSLLTTIENTGFDTIAVDSDGGVTVIGAGDTLLIASTALGQARVTGQVDFAGSIVIRGVALFSTDDGTFALCCGGQTGLRVVQLSQTAQ